MKMYLVRLLIVGETGVGKTSIIIRFNEDNFVAHQRTTIGVDYKAKEIEIDGKPIKLQIWDTAGQERFRSMTAAFYGRAQGIALCFDVGHRGSFEALPSWIREIREIAPGNCSLILCANKVDLPEDQWQVSRAEIEVFANEYGLAFMECSASSGQNVQNIFTELTRSILATQLDQLKEVDAEKQDDGKSINLSEFVDREKRRKRKDKGCCVIV